MIPELMPHDRHPRAIELMQAYEALQARRYDGASIQQRGHWQLTPYQMRQRLLVVCHRTSGLPAREFEAAVYDLLAACATFPLRVSEPPPEVQHASFSRSLPSFERDLGGDIFH